MLIIARQTMIGIELQMQRDKFIMYVNINVYLIYTFIKHTCNITYKGVRIM